MPASVSHRPSFLDSTAITGVGMTALSRRSGRTVLDLAAEACRAALDDAGLAAADVSGIGSFSLGGDSVRSQAVATALAVPELRWTFDLDYGGQSPCLLVMHAAAAVAGGLADTVLVYRALNGRSGRRVGSTRDHGPTAQYRQPIGLTAWPQYQALWARRFLHDTGQGEADLAAVALAQREWAQLNERAVVRKPLTPEDYLASPWVVEPFRVADCTIEVDGACALVVQSAERAAGRPHAVVAGAAYRAGPRSGLDIADVLAWPDYSRNFTSLLAGDLWGSAGMRPSEVDVAEIYDCFTHAVLMGLEGLGLAGRGESGAFVAGGATRPGGALPVNTHGGLLCEGYLHGMNSVAEAVLQLQGRCGERQVPDARKCVVTSGALVDGSALVLRAGE